MGAALDGEGISRLRKRCGIRHKVSNVFRTAGELLFDRALHLDTSVPRAASDASALSGVSGVDGGIDTFYANEKSDAGEKEKEYVVHRDSDYSERRMRAGSDASGTSGVSEVSRMSGASGNGLPTYRMIENEFSFLYSGDVDLRVPTPVYGSESV